MGIQAAPADDSAARWDLSIVITAASLEPSRDVPMPTPHIAAVDDAFAEAVLLHQAKPDKKAAWRRAIELLRLVGVPDPAERVKQYPHEFSGGMRQRAMIAMALANDPAVLIADEPTTALDVTVQAQILELIERIKGEYQIGVILITHDLGVIADVAQTVMVMYAGRAMELGARHEVFGKPLHPYTKALMSAVPIPDPVVEDTRERILLAGDLPSAANPPSGCRFRTRCPWAQPTKCASDRPPLVESRPNHLVACHWVDEIEAGTLRPHAVEAELVRPDDELEIPTLS